MEILLALLENRRHHFTNLKNFIEKNAEVFKENES
jgi:hypothetical protein